MARIAEEVRHVELRVGPVRRERVDDGFCRKPLVDEERQRRNVEGEPLGLAGPVEERPAQALQAIDGIGE